MASTDLGQLLQNHVVSGVFNASALVNGTTLKFVGSDVQQVLTLQNGQLWLGNAPIVQTNIIAANGVMHILGSFLTTDLSFNETAITAASKLGDFGPFDLNKVCACMATFSSFWASCGGHGPVQRHAGTRCANKQLHPISDHSITLCHVSNASMMSALSQQCPSKAYSLMNLNSFLTVYSEVNSFHRGA